MQVESAQQIVTLRKKKKYLTRQPNICPQVRGKFYKLGCMISIKVEKHIHLSFPNKACDGNSFLEHIFG